MEFNPNNQQPFTPIDQTLKTPMEAPANPLLPPPLHHQNSYNNHQQQSLYQNPQYNGSDDILTDIDEPNTTTKRNPYNNNGIKNSSISNLSLSEMNIMNYNNQQQQQQCNNNSTCNSSIRSRSSSINLRKQSLTRNNSNNWLHIGNMNQIRPQHNNFEFNKSTDSLMDYVPNSIISKTSHQPHTPPPIHNDSDMPMFTRTKSSSSSTNSSFKNNLSIDTNYRNNNSANGFSLDSPFLSSITPNDEYFNYQIPQQQQQRENSQPTTPTQIEEINIPNHVSLSEKKRDSLKLKRGIH
ncbi:uncharacterized protein KGF55_002501 [Candida pseudojiufengensis]|uniref:uncharacterized protein n=1 Tax=Candida pseudojiufengensis TaxID=497109 RepID=UPI0022252F2D|nr:uncharacterized protein KGF55_002501 [Candida pseudojiufengensis]KAI5963621.1 hypothetical protein KGF55_002501 [Candida pseudojiufengensis]